MPRHPEFLLSYIFTFIIKIKSLTSYNYVVNLGFRSLERIKQFELKIYALNYLEEDQ